MNDLILVIDDDLLGLKLLNVLLKKAGYRVQLYQSAIQALKDIENIHPDMILLDIMMSEIDGYDVCTQLKSNQETKDIPVIFVTGKDEPKEIVQGFQVGAVDYITKPIKRAELLARLNTHLTITKLQRQIQKHNQVLQDSESRFRALFEYAPVGIIILDEKGEITLVNENFVNIFGYQQEELFGKQIEYILPERYHKEHKLLSQIYRDNPVPRKMRYQSAPIIYGKCKDGTEIPVEVGLSSIKNTEKNLYMAYISDISDLVRAQAEQVKLAAELKTINEGLEEIVEKRTSELKQAQEKLLLQQKLQQEVELAALIQENLLPREVPSFENIQIAARALPASLVSGDIYDFFQPDLETCQILVADISGKGIPAALLSSTARTLFRAETEHEDSPACILKKINTFLYDDLSNAEMFITYLVARLNPQLATLTYASAGHTESVWWRHQEKLCQILPSSGLPIGILKELSLADQTFNLRPGDIFLFYSDGITEASNKEEELFGFERFTKLVEQNAHLSAEELATNILDTIETFRGGASRSDDLTLIIIKILPKTICFITPATMQLMDKISRTVYQLTRGYGDEFAYQFELATSEIVTNIVQHAYADNSTGEIRVSITLELDYVQLDLYDAGTAIDKSKLSGSMPVEPKEGGYGLFIVNQIADKVDYIPNSPNGNHWMIMKKTIKG